jgi:c-di-AMP phosphodiesterase-like protein
MKGYWLNHYFPNMMKQSMEQMPSFLAVKKAMEKAGFIMIKKEKYFVQSDLEDAFLYIGKHQPSIYFNEQIRKGISSFSSLANKDEVERGLQLLSNDIGSGKINEVINNYSNDQGDYLFIYSKKG